MEKSCDSCARVDCAYGESAGMCSCAGWKPIQEESCDNCAKKVGNTLIRCAGYTSPCASWEKIVAIPEWMERNLRRMANTISHEEAKEQGYDQAISDMEDWWANKSADEKGPEGCPMVTESYHMLENKKKERFDPEPDKFPSYHNSGDFTPEDAERLKELLAETKMEPPKPDMSGISTDDLADELFKRGITE